MFSTVIAMAAGILVLLGYFFSVQLLFDLRYYLVQVAVILAGFAVFVGTINLLSVHITKIRKKQKGGIYGLFLVFALLLTFFVSAFFGPTAELPVLIFSTIQLPVEASLMALLTVSLTVASIRMLRHRMNLFSIVFLATALLSLIGMLTLPLLGEVPVLGNMLRPYLVQVFAAGGARGILIGVALGTLTAGLRILLGADRPYGGK
ncbi:MAG: hypothetical protein JXB85_01950 [Anaerolineales bacterium]|nr:hypothetical protein [Anaerolineales bacterium]